MMSILIFALLLSNLLMVALLAKQPRAPDGTGTVPPLSPAADKESSDGDDDGDIVKIVRIAVHEAVPEVLKVTGCFCDADPDDIADNDTTEHEKHPRTVPDGRLDEVFSNTAVTASDLDGEEQEVLPPRAEGLDFESMQKTLDVLKGRSDSREDIETAVKTLPEIAGTEYFERIALDPIVRKRVLMIECQLPVMMLGPENGENTWENKPAKKIVFQADIDTSGTGNIDFNIYR